MSKEKESDRLIKLKKLAILCDRIRDDELRWDASEIVEELIKEEEKNEMGKRSNGKMTIQINNQSKRFLGFVTGIVASMLTEYQTYGDHSTGTTYEGDLMIEWRTEEGILIFTVTDL